MSVTFKGDIFVTALRGIPGHHSNYESVDSLATALSAASGISMDAATAYVNSCVAILSAFDAIIFDSGQLKLRNQVTTYFRDSLVAYLRAEHKILANWDRQGTVGAISVDHLLDRAPYFLRILEDRRLGFDGDDAVPVRHQPCAVIFIKGEIHGKTCLLHQWDQEAERFQLIGGKCRLQEQPQDTARREFQEELADNSLTLGQDFEISPLGIPPIEELSVSRTYGALTKYTIHGFKAVIKRHELTLSAADRWLPLDQIRACATEDRLSIAPLLTKFETAVPSLIANLQTSIVIKAKRSWWDVFMFRPNVYGIGLDLDKLRSKKRT